MRPTHRQNRRADFIRLVQSISAHRCGILPVLFGAITFFTFLVVVVVVQAASQTWSGGASGNNTAWYTTTNWVGGAFPGSSAGVTTNTDVATIPTTGTSNPNNNIGINLNTPTGNTHYLGAISFTGTVTRAMGDSSATSGIVQLNGATVNSVNNVILRNSGTATFTLQNNGGSTGAMNVALGNSTDNIINIDNSGGITISAIITGSARKLTLAGVGSGALTLSGANTYSGGTTITAGRLVLGAAGVLADAGAVTLNGGKLQTGATTGFTETVGTLALADTSIIALGTGSHTLNFANSSGVTWTSGKQLTITGWVGGYNGTAGTAGQIFVGTNASGLTSGQVSQIKFNLGSVNYPATILSTGEVVPIASPTAVRMGNFTATTYNDGVMLEWQSGFEVNNLGYNLYRFENGQRTLVTPSLIAGSALMTRAGNAFNSGFSYGWFDSGFDSGGSAGAQYMLEAVDLNGETAVYAPQHAAKFGYRRAPRRDRSLMIADMAATGFGPATQRGWPSAADSAQAVSSLEMKSAAAPSSSAKLGSKSISASLATQQWIAAQPGVKLQVRKPGFYRVTQAELSSAGFDVSADPDSLQLYLNAEEQAIRVNLGANSSTLGPDGSVEFYGAGTDALTTDTQTYYLVSGARRGLRIRSDNAKGKGGWVVRTDKTAAAFGYTVESRERVVYLPGLINGDADNILGRPVTATPVTQTLALRDLAGAGAGAQLEVVLQGYTSVGHQVQVRLNGTYLDTINFNGAALQSTMLPIPSGLLQEGNNSIVLTAAGGQSDLSFVDRVRVTYPRSYRAENDSLGFSVGADTALIDGFTTDAIRVLDVTNPDAVREVVPRISRNGNSYRFMVSGSGSGARRFIAIADSQAEHPTITPNQPSSMNAGLSDADLVIIAHSGLRQSVEPLAAWRRAQGMRVAVVDIEDVYDEFSYGAHTPEAVRDFLAWVQSHSVKPPRYVLLAGDSSWDPRNYLGHGRHDYVPTKMVGTVELETASDDWLVDFNADGAADMAVGRLPARTPADANAMVTKIIAYDQERAAGGPLRGALLVSDQGFESQTSNVSAQLSASTTVKMLSRSVIGDDTAMRTQIVDAINQGPAIVNYFGHGSIGVWTGAGLLNRDNAAALTNGSQPSLFVLMTCLNGYSHDAAVDSLGETLMKDAGGGAFAVWASTGQTVPIGQAAMNQHLYELLLGNPAMTLGDAIRQAKMSTSDLDVRRTWILLGDPSMKLR